MQTIGYHIIADMEQYREYNRAFQEVHITKQHTREEAIYYKSDHHWTSLGAKYAFDAMKEALGTAELTGDLGTDTPEDFLQVYNVTNDFSGTMASTSGDFSVKDSIDIYVYEIEEVLVAE